MLRPKKPENRIESNTNHFLINKKSWNDTENDWKKSVKNYIDDTLSFERNIPAYLHNIIDLKKKFFPSIWEIHTHTKMPILTQTTCQKRPAQKSIYDLL